MTALTEVLDMNLYSTLVFLHVLGAVGLFMVLAIEALALGQLRRIASPADARAWMGVLRVPARLGPAPMLTTLATGMWLAAKWWGPRPWIIAALIGIVLMAVLGGAVTGRRMRRLGAALGAESGDHLSPAFDALRMHPALISSLRLRAAIGTGILALMTFKPNLVGSTVILIVAVAAGLLVQMALRRRAAIAPAPRIAPAGHDRLP